MFYVQDLGIQGNHHPQDFHQREISCCDRQPIYIALIILGVVGIGVVGGMGIASFGASHSWWSISAPLSQIGQMKAIALIAGGGGGGFLLLVIGSVGSVRSYYKSKYFDEFQRASRGQRGQDNLEEVRRLQEQVRQLEEGNRNLQGRVILVEDQLRKERKEKGEQSERALLFEEQVRQKDQKLLDVNLEKSRLEAELRKKEEILVRLQSEHEGMHRSELLRLEEELKGANSAKKRLEEEKRQILEEKNRFEEETHRLKEEVELKNARIRKMEFSFQKQEESIRLQQRTLEERKSQIEELQRNKERGLKEIESLQRELESARKEKKEAEEIRDRLGEELEIERKALLEVQEKLENAGRVEHGLREEKRLLEQRLREHEEILRLRIQTVESLKSQLRVTQLQVEELERLGNEGKVQLEEANKSLKFLESQLKLAQLSKGEAEERRDLLEMELRSQEPADTSWMEASILFDLHQIHGQDEEKPMIAKDSQSFTLIELARLLKGKKFVFARDAKGLEGILFIDKDGHLRRETKKQMFGKCVLHLKKLGYEELKEVYSTEKPDLLVDEWEVVGSSSSIVNPLGRVEQAWKTFGYDQVAEQKYQTVLDEYVRNLGFAKLKQLRSEVEESLRLDAHNQLLIHLQKVLLYLTEPEVNGSRASYQYMVKELRAAINSPEYRKISDVKREELHPDQLKLRDFVRQLCLVRWKGTHIHNYLKDIVLLTIGKDTLPELELKTYPDTVLKVNKEVKHSALNKKSKVALEGQKLSGALGLEDFCGTKNTPNVRCIQYFRNEKGEILPITYARHGTPTALGDDYYSMGIAARTLFGPLGRLVGYEMESGEEVTVDYHEYLKTMEENKESELFCVYQRRTPNVVENERTRVLKIEGLQETHPNIHVLTQPVEGDLFEHEGEYAEVGTFEELKKALEVEFFEKNPKDPTTRASLPSYLRDDPVRKEAYRKEFRKILDDVQEIFFPDQKEAVDLSLSSSVLEIDSKLEKAYSKRAETIKALVLESEFKDLKRVEGASVEEEVLEKLLGDRELAEFLKSQVTDLDQLAKWVEVDREKTLEEHLKNPEILKELIKNVVGSAAEKIPKSESTAQLEQQKAEFLAKWQSYILLVYAFQKMDLKFRLNGVKGFKLTAFKSPCKDFLDRGGIQGFVEDRLLHYMLGVEDDPEKMEEALYNLLGPPILVKKKEAIERRIIPGMNVERILASMSEESRRRLAAYTFGPEKWKPADMEIPKLKGQSGMPSLPRQIRLEIARAIPASIEEIEADKEKWTEEIVGIFQKYAGIELGQWEPIELAKCERIYQTDSRFDPGKIRHQVERDLKPQVGVQFEIIGTEEHPKDFDSLMKVLLTHPLVNGDEQKALKILASFHQGTGAEAITPITSALGGALGSLMTVAQKIPRSKDDIVRHYKLDLSRKDSISIQFTDSYYLKGVDSGALLAGLKASAVIDYRPKGMELTSEGYVGWSVKG